MIFPGPFLYKSGARNSFEVPQIQLRSPESGDLLITILGNGAL